jgi:diguanylate cyclase (GGDEF)-like protein/PAS domain S-box-containing protein
MAAGPTRTVASASRRAVVVALLVFGSGLSAAVVALDRYDDAYGWVAHTSDVRLVIGRAVGHAAGDGSCAALGHDLDELARLTVDNPTQRDRVRALRASVARRCAGDPEPHLVAQLAALDATERQLMAERRDRLATTRRFAIVAFIGAAIAAMALVALAAWQQQRAMRALAVSEERFRMMAAKASDLIRIHDATGQTTFASPSCERLLGYTPDEMVNMSPIVQLGHPDDLPAMKEALVAIQERSAPPSMLRYRLRTKTGDYRWFETYTDPVRDLDGTLIRFYTTARDVTDRVEAEQQLERLSVTDELTGLLNRRGFMMVAGQEHRIAVRQKLGLAIVFADLDGLKQINDQLGHELGDRAIRQVGEILRATFRESDVVARLGGDEFAALAYDVDAARVEVVLARVRAAVEHAAAADPQPYRLAVSLGLALLEPGAKRSLHDLIGDADAQMYEVKRARKAGLPRS